MKKSLHVAVCGATGAVGREMLKTLAERNFPCASITALASARSAGTKVPYGDTELTVKEMTKDSFKGIDLAIFSAGGSASKGDDVYYYGGNLVLGGKLEIGRIWVGSYPCNGLVAKGYYEFGEDGAMLNGFEMLSDGLYYYTMGVAKYIGLVVIDSDLYYIEEGGKVVTGTVWVGTYASNGLLPKGNYTFDESGKFVK